MNACIDVFQIRNGSGGRNEDDWNRQGFELSKNGMTRNTYEEVDVSNYNDLNMHGCA